MTWCMIKGYSIGIYGIMDSFNNPFPQPMPRILASTKTVDKSHRTINDLPKTSKKLYIIYIEREISK